jgi:[ribosomal protein S5]-alanine N-acetyltransferase
LNVIVIEHPLCLGAPIPDAIRQRHEALLPVNQFQRPSGNVSATLQDVHVSDDVVLMGSRVMLRPPRIDDAEALFARVASDPEVTRYLSWTPHADVDETRSVITDLFNVGEDRTWVIVLKDTGDVIGQIGYLRPRPHAVEVGYCLGREWWGRGLMAEALRLIVDMLRDDPSVYRISAACHVDNTRSARLLDSSGLTFEGRLARYAVFPNLGPEPQDGMLYAAAVR